MKEIGDWAEQRVLESLKSLRACAEIVHRAAQGKTRGWDIDYNDPSGVLHRVEVKGTVAAAFTHIDLTANELSAAREQGDRCWVYLVGRCMGSQHRIQRICHLRGEWVAKSAHHSISLT